MKKLFLISMILLGNITFAYSQTFKEFHAKEGLATAVSQVINSGMTTPDLYLVATTSEKSSSMPPALSPSINMNTGASNVWLYQFRESTDTNKKAFIAVVKISLGVDQFIAQSLNDISMINQMPAIGAPLPGQNWMNSDSMMISLNQSAKYMLYKNSHTNTRIQVTLLGMNTFNQIFELNKPYWFGIITADNANGNLNCITNCWSGVTTCLDINSVTEDNHGNPVKMYPNPASNVLTVEIPKNWNSGRMSITIFDYSGNEVLRTDVKDAQAYLMLPLEFLPNGQYIISINDGSNSVDQMFVVSK